MVVMNGYNFLGKKKKKKKHIPELSSKMCLIWGSETLFIMRGILPDSHVVLDILGPVVQN